MASSAAFAVADQPPAGQLAAVHPSTDTETDTEVAAVPSALRVEDLEPDLAAIADLLATLGDAQVAALAADLATARTPRLTSLVEHLLAVADGRDGRGIRHHLLEILVLAACAVLAGRTTYIGIARWVARRGQAVRAALIRGGWIPDPGAHHRRRRPRGGRRGRLLASNVTPPGAMPCESTIRRTLQALPAAALAAALASWTIAQLSAARAAAADAGVDRLVPINARRPVISIDGKTIRGSGTSACAGGPGARVHVVSAYEHASALTVGQVVTGAHNTHPHDADATGGGGDCESSCTDGSDRAGKGGEVAAAHALIADLHERGMLAGAVVTGDAGFTAKDLAGDILARGGQWVLRVKGNNKIIHERLKALPWKEAPQAARVHTVGHGRTETRTIKVIDLAASRDTAYAERGEFYPGAAQAAKIVRRRKVGKGKWQVKTVYVITSLAAGQVDPALLATWVRDHWGIESRLHWVKDMTWNEDHRQVRTRNGPANLSALTTLAINALRLAGYTNMAAGRDDHVLNPLQPLITYGLL